MQDVHGTTFSSCYRFIKSSPDPLLDIVFESTFLHQNPDGAFQILIACDKIFRCFFYHLLRRYFLYLFENFYGVVSSIAFLLNLTP
jgi:hypothetical protein